MSPHTEFSQEVPEDVAGFGFGRLGSRTGQSGIAGAAWGLAFLWGCPRPTVQTWKMALVGPRALLKGGCAWVGPPWPEECGGWFGLIGGPRSNHCAQPVQLSGVNLMTFSLVCFLPPVFPFLCLSSALLP